MVANTDPEIVWANPFAHLPLDDQKLSAAQVIMSMARAVRDGLSRSTACKTRIWTTRLTPPCAAPMLTAGASLFLWISIGSARKGRKTIIEPRPFVRSGVEIVLEIFDAVIRGARESGAAHSQ